MHELKPCSNRNLSFFAKIAGLWRDSYGVVLYVYEDEKFVFYITQKSWATSVKLGARIHLVEQTPLKQTKGQEDISDIKIIGSDCTTDPRVLMTHILSGRLALMVTRSLYDKQLAEKEINEVLPAPSIEEAVDWLERNRFIGDNAIGLESSKDNPRPNAYSGWDISTDRDLFYLPPKIKPLYDKYRNLWNHTKTLLSEGKLQ